MLRPLPILIAGFLLTACVKMASANKKAIPMTVLAGSEWEPSSPLSTREQFVAFKSDGAINGHAGCNRFFGQYEQDGIILKVGPLASTKMACDAMKAEHEFMQALQNTRTMDLSHMQLSLLGEQGEVLMQLRRRDWD